MSKTFLPNCKELRIKPHKISFVNWYPHQKETPPQTAVPPLLRALSMPAAAEPRRPAAPWAHPTPTFPSFQRLRTAMDSRALNFLIKVGEVYREKHTCFGEVLPNEHLGLILQCFVLLASLQMLAVHVWSSV